MNHRIVKNQILLVVSSLLSQLGIRTSSSKIPLLENTLFWEYKKQMQ